MLIAFEGIEGSGKSTLVAGVAERLAAAGCDPLLLREPGGTPTGDAVRALFLKPGLRVDPMTEAFLINASRAQLVAEVLRPALLQQRLVLCDRYMDSTLAYQGYGRGLDLAMLRALCDAATGGLMPDLTFVVDISVATSRKRLHARAMADDRMEAEDLAFHERVRDGFLALAKTSQRFRVLDGEQAQPAVLNAAMRELSALAV